MSANILSVKSINESKWRLSNGYDMKWGVFDVLIPIAWCFVERFELTQNSKHPCRKNNLLLWRHHFILFGNCLTSSIPLCIEPLRIHYFKGNNKLIALFFLPWLKEKWCIVWRCEVLRGQWLWYCKISEIKCKFSQFYLGHVFLYFV